MNILIDFVLLMAENEEKKSGSRPSGSTKVKERTNGVVGAIVSCHIICFLWCLCCFILAQKLLIFLGSVASTCCEVFEELLSEFNVIFIFYGY